MTDSTLLRVIIGLVLVVAAILISAWLARRAGLAGKQGTGVLQYVGGLSLSPRQRIVVLQIEDTWLVVGVTPNQLISLHTLPAGQIPQGASEGIFAGKLAQVLKRR